MWRLWLLTGQAMIFSVAGQFFGRECSHCPVPDHFKTLDLAEDATTEAIKKQCRSLKKKFHPDKNKSDEAKQQWGPLDEACRILTRNYRNSTFDGIYEDTYEAYIAKRHLCRQCAGRDEESSYWSANRFAEQMKPSSVKTEEFVKDGRKYYRDVRCREHSSGSGPWRECLIQNYLEVNTGGESEWMPSSSEYYFPDDEDSPQHDSFLHAGEFLKNGAFITSEDGTHFAIMLPDGNLAIYEGSSPSRIRNSLPIWETSTHTFSPTSYCQLQVDGNLAIYTGESPDRMESILWHTNKRGVVSSGARYYGQLNNDGNLVVWEEIDGGYERRRECLWASIGCPDSSFFDNPVSAILLMRNSWRLKSHQRAFEPRSESWKGSTYSGIQWIRDGFQNIWQWINSKRKAGVG